MKDLVLRLTALIAVMMIALTAAGSEAPDVIGKVIDENGEPMPFVNVVMMSMPDSAYVQGGITDEEGTFKLTALQNGGLVKISYIGYQTLFINTSAVDLGTITLQPEAVLLGEVVVMSTLPKTRVKGNAIKLLACNASYWRGDAKRESLQRIYGIAFPKKDELDAITAKALDGHGGKMVESFNENNTFPKRVEAVMSEYKYGTVNPRVDVAPATNSWCRF